MRIEHVDEQGISDIITISGRTSCCDPIVRGRIVKLIFAIARSYVVEQSPTYNLLALNRARLPHLDPTLRGQLCF